MRNRLTKRLFATLSLLFFAFAHCFGQSITNPTHICYGKDAVYSTLGLQPNSHSFSWSVVSGTYWGSPSSSTQSFTVQWRGGPTMVKLSYKYDVSTYDTIEKKMKTKVFPASITSTAQNLVNPLNGPATTVSISVSSSTICLNESTTLTANISGGTSEAKYTYLWSNGSTSKVITVTPSKTITYTVKAWNQCDPASFNSPGFTVTVNPLPAFTVTSSATGKVCPQTQVTLTATPNVTGTNYIYTWSPATNPGTGSPVVVAPSVSTTYTATATNPSTGCKNYQSKLVDVYPVAVVHVANKELLVCGNPGNFTMTASNAYSYTWSPSTGLNSTTGASVSGSIDPANTPVVYTVTGKNNDPCTNTSDSEHITIYGGPPKPETVYGPSNVDGPLSPAYLCMNPSDHTYSISTNLNSPSKTHYYWYFTTMGGASLGSYSNYGQTSVLAHINTSFTGTKTLEVKATNACGNTIIGRTNIIVNAAVPSNPTVVAVGPAVCDKNLTYGYRINYLTPNNTVDYEITPISAVSSMTPSGPYSNINIKWNPSSTGTAYIRARVKNGCGYSAWSPQFAVNLSTGPTINGFTNVCNSGANNTYSLNQMVSNPVWTFNPSNAVSSHAPYGPYGARTIDWNNAYTGPVTISVTVPNNSCPGTKVVNVSAGTCTGSGRQGLVDNQSSIASGSLWATIQPNPFTGFANIEVTNVFLDNSTVEIFDAKGVKVYTKEDVSSGTAFEIGQDLLPGLYTVRIRSDNDMKVLKFVKQD